MDAEMDVTNGCGNGCNEWMESGRTQLLEKIDDKRAPVKPMRHHLLNS